MNFTFGSVSPSPVVEKKGTGGANPRRHTPSTKCWTQDSVLNTPYAIPEPQSPEIASLGESPPGGFFCSPSNPDRWRGRASVGPIGGVRCKRIETTHSRATCRGARSKALTTAWIVVAGEHSPLRCLLLLANGSRYPNGTGWIAAPVPFGGTLKAQASGVVRPTPY
jgi:hypothetical protein